tara:strand:+ start:597 stop:1745 length:1149 start_codon:yes stop_codon:yes gene_type:complete
MLPVAIRLSNLGYKVLFIDASEIYLQDIFVLNFQFERHVINGVNVKAFAYLSFFDKVKVLKKFKESVKDVDSECLNSFIYGNDGALQRVLIDKYKSRNHFLILDGIISDYSFSFVNIIRYSNNKFFDVKDFVRRICKKALNFIFAYLPYNYYLPSDVGCSRLTKVFVISDYVSRHIKSQILRDTQVIVSGMPRYEFLKDYNSMISEDKIKIIYITQGYIWHKEYENDKFQHETINKLILNLEKNKLESKYQLTVRVHPRDNLDSYNYLSEKKWIILEDMSTDIYCSINANDIVLGVNSTVLLEAMAIGKKVIFLFLNNQYWRFKRSFINHNIFHKAFDFEQFMSQIIDFNLDSNKSMRFDHFFYPNAEKSIDIIVNEITEND